MADDRYDLVWFWRQNDSGLYGRRQDLMLRNLAASPRVRRVVHFDRPLTPGELLSGVTIERHPLQRHANRVLLQTLPRLVPRTVARKLSKHTFLYAQGARGSRRMLERILPGSRDYAGYVRRILARRRIGSGRTVFWVYPRNLSFPALLRDLAPPLIVADCVDDQRASPQASPRFVERTTANYREVLGIADLVLTNCEGMRHAMSEFRDDVRIVESGYEGARARRGCPRDLARVPRPILGYAGNPSARLDIALLQQLALRHPAWSVVLIGPVPDDVALRELGALPNVHLLGVRPHPHVRDYIRHFDVALLPHLDTELSRTMAPLKLGVYCAEGVPVVATHVANLGALAEVIDVASSADEFVAQVERALRTPESDERRQRRDAILAAGSWERRAEQVLALLDEAWESRGARRRGAATLLS
jgi:glycosyltransferase involved in cell wall biosynthesis